MKKLFFGLVATGFIMLSSFTTVDTKETVGTVPCKWRTVYTHANGSISYTEWIHGNCNVSDSGRLYPIQ